MLKRLLILTLVAAALLVLPSCTPDENRSIGLGAFARAGASPATLRRVDCIMFRESRYTDNARHRNRNGSWDLGLFQINSVHAAQFKRVTGYDYWSTATNPFLNAEYAVDLWRRAGLSPWAGGCLR